MNAANATNGFKLLHAPALVRHNVLQQIRIEDYADHLQFYHLSKRFQRVIVQVHCPHTGFDIVIGKEGIVLKKMCGRAAQNSIYYKQKLPNHTFRRFESHIKRCRNLKQVKIEILAASKAAKRPIRNVSVAPLQSEFSNTPFSFPFDTCDNVTFEERSRPNTFYINSFLDNCQVIEQFKIGHHMTRDMRIDLNKITAESVVFNKSCCWITCDDISILMRRCRKVKIVTGVFKARHFEQMIGHWMASLEVKDFAYLEIEFTTSRKKEILHLEEFNPMQFSRERRSNYFTKGFEHMKLGHGKDLERSDNLLSTYHLDGKRFIFAVWHKRFPMSSQNH